MNGTRPRVLFVSHSASRNGATILLLSLLSWLKPRVDWDIEIVVQGRGPLLDEFRAIGRTTVWRDPGPALATLLPASMSSSRKRIASAYARLALPSGTFDLIYANTTAVAELACLLLPRARELLWHVHELGYAMDLTLARAEWVSAFRSATRYVAVSNAVRKALIEKHAIDATRVDLVNGFVTPHNISADAALAKRKQFRADLQIPTDAFLVGGCGSLGWRKGSDIFLQIAHRIATAGSHADIRFLWVGGSPGEPAVLEFEHDMRLLGVDRRCRLVPATSNALEYYCAMDAFALTSREDPFPLVVLEAAEHGLPIVCFDGAGGAPEFVGNDAGLRAPYLDIEGFTQRLVQLRDDRRKATQLGESAQRKVLATFLVELQGPKMLRSIQRCLAGPSGDSVFDNSSSLRSSTSTIHTY